MGEGYAQTVRNIVSRSSFFFSVSRVDFFFILLRLVSISTSTKLEVAENRADGVALS